MFGRSGRWIKRRSKRIDFQVNGTSWQYCMMYMSCRHRLRMTCVRTATFCVFRFRDSCFFFQAWCKSQLCKGGCLTNEIKGCFGRLHALERSWACWQVSKRAFDFSRCASSKKGTTDVRALFTPHSLYQTDNDFARSRHTAMKAAEQDCDAPTTPFASHCWSPLGHSAHKFTFIYLQSAANLKSI